MNFRNAAKLRLILILAIFFSCSPARASEGGESLNPYINTSTSHSSEVILGHTRLTQITLKQEPNNYYAQNGTADSNSGLTTDDWTQIWVQIWSILGPLATLLLGGLSAYLNNNRENLLKNLKATINDLKGITSPVIIPKNESANSIIVIGLSGSGKTSLIKKLASTSKANPNISTDRFEIFSRTIESPADQPAVSCKFYLADYPGQTALTELIGGFIEQQLKPFSPMRFRYVNSLIVVVDLFSPPNLPGNLVSKSNDIDDDRVQENINQWNEQALSAVFGLLPPASKLKYICLFINKVDLLTQRSSNDEICNKYESLYDKLVDKVPRGMVFQRIVGSCETGEGIPILEKDLIDNSVTNV